MSESFEHKRLIELLEMKFAIREWIDLLAEEAPGELIYVSEVVNSIRRMIE